MNPQDIRTLKLLEALEAQEAPSQRDLATSLGISLGLVNTFIKGLARKGYFKITHLPRNRIAYILTPSGAAEKTRLTYEYIRFSLNFYKVTRERVQMTYRMLVDKGVRRVGFCGVSELAEIAYLLIQNTSLKLVAVYDPERVGERFLSFTVEAWPHTADINLDHLLVTAMPPGRELKAQLAKAGVPWTSLTPME
jgi:DNA-binding MarR family transcriptional regulator